MAAPRPLVVITLMSITVAAISVAILAWLAIGTSRHLDRVVDKADRVADDASRSVRRLDRTTNDLDPAIRSLQRAADALRRDERRHALTCPPRHRARRYTVRLPGRLAQLGERRLDKAEVTGSSPVSPIVQLVRMAAHSPANRIAKRRLRGSAGRFADRSDARSDAPRPPQ
jgi:hypothetical protein